MAIPINDSIRIQGSRPIEDKRLDNGLPYNSIQEVNDKIHKTDRYPSLEVCINDNGVNKIYSYENGVEDDDLVIKTTNQAVDKTLKGDGTIQNPLGLSEETIKTFAKIDASNHTSKSILQWKSALGVGDLPTNVATVDEAGKVGNVYSKEQTDSNYYKKVANPGDGKTYLLKIDGTSVDASNFGKVDKVMGISPDSSKNVDISGVAMNWTNPQQRFSGLQSKHNDATYNRLGGFDSNGYFNEVGLPAMTNEMSKANDTRKDAWRLAGLKTDESYSIGVPKIFAIVPPTISKKDRFAINIIVSGSSLFINNESRSAFVTIKRIKDINGIAVNDSPIDVTANVTVSSLLPNMLSIYYEWYNLLEGEYTIKVVHNGMPNIDSSTFRITQELTPVSIPDLTINNNNLPSDFTLRTRGKTLTLTTPKEGSAGGQFETNNILENIQSSGFMIVLSVGFLEPSMSMSGGAMESFVVGLASGDTSFQISVPLLASMNINYGRSSSRYILQGQRSSEFYNPSNKFDYATKLYVSIDKGMVSIFDTLGQLMASSSYTQLNNIKLFGSLNSSTDRITNYTVSIDNIFKLN